MTDDPVQIECVYSVLVGELWEAMTLPERMRLWYFEALEDFRAEVGFVTRFEVSCEGRRFPHVWEVTEVVPGERLVYRWRYEGFAGDSAVSWELAEAAGGTRLRFTHSVQEAFPADEPLFSRESCEAGWRHLLLLNLKEHLEPGA